jgi:hypothetical protein
MNGRWSIYIGMKTIKNYRKLSVLFVTLIISQCSAAVAPGWIVQQVSQGGYVASDSTAAVWGQNVFWQEYIDGKHQTIFWDGSAIRCITDANHDCEEPHIWGTNAVWREYFGSTPQIMLFNGTTTVQVKQNSNYCYGPRVSGSNVVWDEQISGVYSIMFFDGNNSRKISGGFDCDQPAIWDGNVVWLEADARIMLWDGVSAVTIAQAGSNCSNLQISGTKNVVWLESAMPLSAGKVMFWNGSTVQQLSTSSASSTQPRIWDSNVVWIENNQVKLWNGAVTIVLTANSKQKSDPAIWNNIVVWNEKPNGVSVSLIYLWDGEKTIRFTDMAGCRVPSVSEGNIAWIGYNDDYDYQVMFAQPGAVLAPLLGDLNKDNSVDLVDFSFFSNDWLKTNP